MYLTPSIIDGILRVSIAFIVHPTDGYAQIITLYYYAHIRGGFYSSLSYKLSITKLMHYSKSFFLDSSSARKISS